MIEVGAEVAEFAAIMDLESEVIAARASVELAPADLSNYHRIIRRSAIQRAERDLYAALRSLTPAQVSEYGAYRAARRR